MRTILIDRRRCELEPADYLGREDAAQSLVPGIVKYFLGHALSRPFCLHGIILLWSLWWRKRSNRYTFDRVASWLSPGQETTNLGTELGGTMELRSVFCNDYMFLPYPGEGSWRFGAVLALFREYAGRPSIFGIRGVRVLVAQTRTGQNPHGWQYLSEQYISHLRTSKTTTYS